MSSYLDVIEFNNSKKKKNKKNKKINVKYLFNFNYFQLQEYLEYNCYLKEINVNSLKSEYDQIFQQIKNIEKNDKIDLLIVGNDFNSFDFEAEKNIKLYFDQILQQINQLSILKKQNPKLEIIFFNFPKFYSRVSNYANIYKLDKEINYFNLSLKSKCDENKIYLFNYNHLISTFGQKNFYSQKNFFLSKSLISENGNDFLSKELSKLVRSIYYIRKKCLVLDLDNTLWGGILGEDGIHGIKVANSFEGEKFLNFQKYIKQLSSIGVILAIASKNNLEDVKECFEKNDQLFLKLKDFSIIKANWSPKYENINQIAKELNIGKDSMVFIDDSKFEREQMKKYNPDISVIETPPDPALYIDAIDETGYFYLNAQLTREDLKKQNQYKIIQKAEALKKTSTNIDDYLKQLDMTLTITKVNKSNFSRCVQMLNKTNQFNFTTKRYTESSFEKYLENKKIKTIVFSLSDKFGDHGITGLLTAKIIKDALVIDNFLMSCRILGRRVEDQIIYEAFKIAIKYKLKFLVGYYIKTQKNIQCKNFYVERNFTKTGNKKYVMNIKNSKLKKMNFFKLK